MSFDAAGARWSQLDDGPIRLQIEDADQLVASFVAPPVAETTTVQVVLQLTEFDFYAQFITIMPPDTVQVVVGYATGPPGGTASVGVTIRPAGLAIAQVHHELGFEPAAAVADRGDGRPQCIAGPDVTAATFVFLPDGCTPGVSCDRIGAALIARDPLPDEAELYHCIIDVSDAPAETCNHLLTCEGGDAITQDHTRLMLSCVDGSVTSQYDIPQIDVTFEAEPAQPLVGDAVHLTFFVYGRGGDVTATLSGAAPYLSGAIRADTYSFGQISFDLRAECPGTANLQLHVTYETDLGCPGNGTTLFQFVYGESPVYPLRVREPGTFQIYGIVADGTDGCGGGHSGGTVVLQPLGWTAPVPSGSFVFDAVPPGDYAIAALPHCDAFKVWNGSGVHVDNEDVTVTLCPVRRANPCIGDCNCNGAVDIDDLVTGVNAALGMTSPNACASIDPDEDGLVEIDELVRAVSAALEGC